MANHARFDKVSIDILHTEKQVVIARGMQYIDIKDRLVFVELLFEECETLLFL
jgi:hypothetical protein